MEKLLVFMMVMASAFYLWAKDVEIVVADRAYRTLQYALEHAAHDGALEVNNESLANGEIEFIEDLAEETIKGTLQKNLPIDSLLRPVSTTFIEKPLVIKDIFYIDSDFIDLETALPVQFPFIWKYTLPNGDEFERAIFGPSVALVVNAKIKGSDKD